MLIIVLHIMCFCDYVVISFPIIYAFHWISSHRPKQLNWQFVGRFVSELESGYKCQKQA
jgi:hypothetical protein